MRFWIIVVLALGLTVYCVSVNSAAQFSDTADAHVAKAREAAGQEYLALFKTVCTPATTARPPSGPPNRSSWYAEPVKVFDNLYFVGQAEHSAWAVTTSEGIIIVDALFDYSVEDEIVAGLKKLGL